MLTTAQTYDFHHILTMDSRSSWTIISNQYLNAKNGYDIYYNYRRAHSRIYGFIWNSLRTVLRERTHTELEIREKFFKDTGIDESTYEDEQLKAYHDVRDFTGVFYTNNCNLLWEYLIKIYEEVDKSAFNVRHLMNEIMNMKYSPSTDPNAFFNTFDNRVQKTH
jgi:hypothetical protein